MSDGDTAIGVFREFGSQCVPTQVIAQLIIDPAFMAMPAVTLEVKLMLLAG